MSSGTKSRHHTLGAAGRDLPYIIRHPPVMASFDRSSLTLALSINDVLDHPRPAAIFEHLHHRTPHDQDLWALVHLIAAARKLRREPRAARTADQLSNLLCALSPHGLVATTMRAAVLKDNGEITPAAELLARRLGPDCNAHFLRVVGSVLWAMQSRTSAQFAFHLAQHHELHAPARGWLTDETIESLRARLLRTWLPDDAMFRMAETTTAPILTAAELAVLETPIEIPGLAGFTLRPLKSKRQLARTANQLQNCLNSYLAQVVNGTTLIFAVERQGTPVEAIEVNPSTRRIVQWKGPRNTPPRPETRPHIERVLTRVSQQAADTHLTT